MGGDPAFSLLDYWSKLQCLSLVLFIYFLFGKVSHCTITSIAQLHQNIHTPAAWCCQMAVQPSKMVVTAVRGLRVSLKSGCQRSLCTEPAVWSVFVDGGHITSGGFVQLSGGNVLRTHKNSNALQHATQQTEGLADRGQGSGRAACDQCRVRNRPTDIKFLNSWTWSSLNHVISTSNTKEVTIPQSSPDEVGRSCNTLDR
jgi:hypothetical protein